ncbi:hypothetical protein [Blautia segnis]|uniref:Uncharacterized protein n=1 Tax=Blautia segnis TaxID=2763030 RepID=A0A8I0DP03_9FIRM|nr:hypothetical protein [Blautia segnis]MBC5651094.1 hypothetical protein [Blautia segnis]
MGDVSIIARRLADGHVQYGWSGNGGYFSMVGIRLLLWYQEPENVEYLFSLGQTSLIGKIGSEKGGSNWYETHCPTGEPFWLDNTERMIFSRIMFIDYGYFYDLDHKWYYTIPGPFRIKIPLELIENNLDERDYEFKYECEVEARIARFILNDYKKTDPIFEEFIHTKGYTSEVILANISENDTPSLYNLYCKYRDIYDYFDDWILVKSNANHTEISEIVVKKKMDVHIETCKW